MKRISLLLFLLILAACGNETTIPTLPNPVPYQEMLASAKGLSLMLTKDSFTETQPVIDVLIRNDSPKDYHYGAFYHIEVNKEGQWYMITYSDTVFFTNPRFKDSGHLLPGRSEAHQLFSVETLDVELFPGEYRLVKTFLSPGDSHYEISLAVPFTIK